MTDPVDLPFVHHKGAGDAIQTGSLEPVVGPPITAR
jgi:hypothetical protein